MHSSIRRILAPVAVLALALGALTACGEEEPAEFDTATQAGRENADQSEEPDSDVDAQAEDSADTGPDEDEDEDTEDTEDAGDEPGSGSAAQEEGDGSGNTYVRGPQEAIEAITYDLPDNDMEVTVGLHALQVEGDVMLLELSFTPEGGRESTYSFRQFNQGRAMFPVLNDRENLKQYSVLGSGSNRWASNTSSSGTAVESGQSLMFYAYYAAPEDDIDTINISVIDGLVEFTDAEIEW